MTFPARRVQRPVPSTPAPCIPTSATPGRAVVRRAGWGSIRSHRRHPRHARNGPCPMHPEILRDEPGSCPICGMALEPRTALGDTEEENPELRDMTRRLWLAAAFTVPVALFTMGEFLPGRPFSSWVSMRTRTLLELGLATPVCVWVGVAVLRAGGSVSGESQPEHVHPHRPRRECLRTSTASWLSLRPRSSRRRFARQARWPSTSRPRR